MRAGASASAAAVLLLTTSARATEPPTIYDNYQTYPVGSRAAGMGGAYTSLACDEAALHYNPAALACADVSRLELAANAYVIESLHVPDAFGRGEDVSATTYHSIPSIVGGVRVLRDGTGEGRVGRLAFGISVSVPRSISIKADPTSERRSFYRYRVRDDLTTGDIGLGWQVTPWLAIGASIGAALRTADLSVTTLVASQDSYSCGPSEQQATGEASCHGFLAVTTDQEVIAVGGRAKLGARFTPSREVSIGLAITSPTIDVFGRASLFSMTTFAIPTGGAPDPLVTAAYDAAPLRLTGNSDVSLPLRMAAGVSWSTPRLTLALDVSANFPRDVKTAYDLEARDIQGVEEPPQSDLPDTVLSRGFQPNVNVGAEIGILDNVVLDLGAFTDLSSVTDEAVEGSDMAAPQDRVHMFGGSVAVGILSKQSRGWFGLSFEMGKADSKVLRGDLTLENAFGGGLGFDADSTVTRWTLAGTIGSNYSFLPEDDPKPPPPEDQPTRR